MSLQIHPDMTLVIPLSRVRGGKTRQTIKVSSQAVGEDGEGLKTESKVIVKVDNVEERKRAEALVAAALHVVRKHCQSTIVGYLTPNARLGNIDAELAEMRERANTFNAHAETCQVDISALPIPIATALGPEAIRALADHVRDELTHLRDDLRSGEVNKVRATLLRTKNLDALAIGVQADAIRFAIEETETRLRELKEGIKGSRAPENIGRDLDLTMIESAMGMFSYEGMQEKAARKASNLRIVGG